MVVRNIAGILRGKATPTQVFLAGLLGGLLGFVPSARTSPGLLVTWVLLLLVLNANIGICLFVAAGAKLLSLVAMPLTFEVGRWLLDGPTRGLFEAAVNAPVLAWFGLEYYVTTGGLLLGGVVGLVVGLMLSRSLSAFRNKMAGLEVGSDAYKKVAGKWWSRFFLWLLLGSGHGKKSYGELLDKGKGKPVRIVGVVIAALVVVVLFVAPGTFGGTYITGATQGGLESWNGATVDVAGVELDLAAGKLAIDGLALADPNALDTDLFKAARLEADVGTDDLLRKKLTIDRIVVVDGRSGTARATPGVLVGPAPEPAGDEAPEPKPGVDEKSLEDYLADAEVWKERLAQVREWMETFAGDEEDADPAAEEESLRDRLEREIAAKGYAAVLSRDLVRDAPSLLIREVVAEGLQSAQLDGLVDVRLLNLSTQPALVDEATRLTLQSEDGRLDVDVALGGASAAATDNTLRFALLGVATESVAGSLEVSGEPVIAGGSIDFVLDGQWAGGQVGQLDLPLDVTLNGVTVALPTGARRVDQLTLPFGLRGPLDDPRVSFDDDALQQALLAGVEAEIQAVVDDTTAQLEAEAAAKQAELDAKADEALDDAKGKLDEEVSDALGGLFGDDDDEEKKKKKKKKKNKDASGTSDG